MRRTMIINFCKIFIFIHTYLSIVHRLLFNLIDCSESFKTAESWTPICLPKFDSDGFLHAHVSYLSDDCQACLILLSVEKDVFFTLSDAKQKITEVYHYLKVSIVSKIKT